MKKTLANMKDYHDLGIRSKIKFQGDFNNSLAELVGELEITIAKEIISNYGVEYTQYGDQIFKIKIKDKPLLIEKLITCTLFYSKNDYTYGYVTPLFTSAEKGQKTKKHELDKFSISEKEKIVKVVVGKLKEIIEEF